MHVLQGGLILEICADMDIGIAKDEPNWPVDGGLGREEQGGFRPFMTKKFPLRVLVVDDELLIRWSLSETLLEAGHDVAEAQDGKSAIRAVAASAPDVVVLDFRLPDSDNLDLLATIRRLSPHSQVILMTAFGTPEIAKGALDLGAYRIVGKPFEIGELAALVEQAHAERTQR
jgi:DNA-binding NtrC family response regulator